RLEVILRSKVLVIARYFGNSHFIECAVKGGKTTSPIPRHSESAFQWCIAQRNSDLPLADQRSINEQPQLFPRRYARDVIATGCLEVVKPDSFEHGPVDRERTPGQAAIHLSQAQTFGRQPDHSVWIGLAERAEGGVHLNGDWIAGIQPKEFDSLYLRRE